jgi:hypothetical protein
MGWLANRSAMSSRRSNRSGDGGAGGGVPSWEGKSQRNPGGQGRRWSGRLEGASDAVVGRSAETAAKLSFAGDLADAAVRELSSQRDAGCAQSACTGTAKQPSRSNPAPHRANQPIVGNRALIMDSIAKFKCYLTRCREVNQRSRRFWPSRANALRHGAPAKRVLPSRGSICYEMGWRGEHR